MSARGDLYLLRSGLGNDFSVNDPSPSDQVVLELLASGTQDEVSLRRALGERQLSDNGLSQLLNELERGGLTEEAPDGFALDPELLERYDRQLIYFADLAPPKVQAEDYQRRLRDSTVAILGCGGLGSWVACGLACAGIGRLLLVDDDRVERSNLNRQLLYREVDIGRLKADVAAAVLPQHNSRLKVVPIVRRVRCTSDLDFVSDADLLIVTADWPPYELPRWVNEACMDSLVPYITAGQFLPQVRVGPFVLPGRSACNDCLEHHARTHYPLYDELSNLRAEQMPPAATMGAASGIVGSLLAMESIHHLSGLCKPATVDGSLVIDLTSLDIKLEEVPAYSGCSSCQAAAGRASDGRFHRTRSPSARPT